MLFELDHVAIAHYYSTIHRKDISKCVLVNPAKNNLAFLVKLPFEDIFSLVYVLISLFLINIAILIKPLVEIRRERHLLLNGFVKLVMKFYLISRVFLENIIDTTDKKIFEMVTVIGWKMNNLKFPNINFISIMKCKGYPNDNIILIS